MINNLLHRQPVALDRDQHRQLRLVVPVTDWRCAAQLNALFVAAAEFGDTCREYAIVFIRAGSDGDGKPQVAPVAVFGLAQGENLFVAPDGSWRAHYQPALLRSYPFGIARMDAQRFAVCIDRSFAGVREGGSEGQALFDAEGQPSSFMTEAQHTLERVEQEVQRTRLVGQKLLELDLLRDMRFDATLPDGGKIAVDGFLTVDEKRLNELPDAQILELQKNGILGLVHAHWISLGNMRRLVEWRLQHHAAAGSAAQPTAAPAAA